MTTYGFVFARGGSKGLPGKNVRLLGGIPLVAHSILIARRVSAVAKVFVSTEDEEIADIARSYSAEVITRPAELATDSAPEWLAWQHAIGLLQGRGEFFDTFLSLPATSPLRSVADVEACLALLDATTDAVVTVTPAARSPFFNMITRQADGSSDVVFKGSWTQRRQDAPPVFDMTTVAYALQTKFIMEASRLWDGRVKSAIVPKERAADIDDAVDFVVAEALYAMRSNTNAGR